MASKKEVPDMLQLRVKHPQRAREIDPETWTEERYRELLGFAEEQHAAAVALVEKRKADRDEIIARMITLKQKMFGAWDDPKAFDPLLARYLCLKPLIDLVPEAIDELERRAGKLQTAVSGLQKYCDWFAIEARKAAERAEREQAQREAARAQDQRQQERRADEAKTELKQEQRAQQRADARAAAADRIAEKVPD